MTFRGWGSAIIIIVPWWRWQSNKKNWSAFYARIALKMFYKRKAKRLSQNLLVLVLPQLHLGILSSAVRIFKAENFSRNLLPLAQAHSVQLKVHNPVIFKNIGIQGLKSSDFSSINPRLFSELVVFFTKLYSHEIQNIS